MSNGKPITVGGQAVIEGVMMRSPHGYAVAVRRADGTIQSDVQPHLPLGKRVPVFRFPILRGAGGLFEMMAIGMKSLEYSAQQAALDDPAEIAKLEKKAAKSGEPNLANPLGKAALVLTMIFSMGLGIFLFVVVPNLVTHFLGTVFSADGQPLLEERDPVIYNLISGAIRVMIVVGYIYAISFMKDVRRLFQYHGAEHKAVSAFEAKKELTVENVRPFTIFHPRCGTTFIAITLMVAILVFSIMAHVLTLWWPAFHNLSFWQRKLMLILGHILIMPIVAGVCFELLQLGGKFPNNPLLKMLIWPGFMFQRLTVKEPDDTMIEVACESLKQALAIREPAPAAVAVARSEEALEGTAAAV